MLSYGPLDFTLKSTIVSDLYIYADASLTQTGRLIAPELSTATERHKVQFRPPELRATSNVLREMAEHHAAGIIIGLSRGWPGLGNLRFAGRLLRAGNKVFFYWPAEGAVEVIDRDRLRSYWHLWSFVSAHEYFLRPFRKGIDTARFLSRQMFKVREIAGQSKPVPLDVRSQAPGEYQILGTGVYLRTDFWHPIISGGSYGHTCYVAKALSRTTDDLICFVPYRFKLLDDLGIHQVVLPRYEHKRELSLVEASFTLPSNPERNSVRSIEAGIHL